MTRAGFVALAGRPNVGKSTFLNAAVGGKVAIVSDRPQTTRRAIRGVCTVGEAQLALVDLPGVQRPRDTLTARMSQRVRQELEGADAALLILNGEQGVGAGDRFIAHTLLHAAAAPATPVAPAAPVAPTTPVATPAVPATSAAPAASVVPAAPAAPTATPLAIAVNKIDRLSRAGTLAALAQAAELGLEGEIFPVSARTGHGVAELLAHLGGLMPPGPFMFATDARSDQPLRLLVAELIREALLRRTFQEVPHAAEVVVEELEHPRPELARVRALIWVESESQKGIVVGAHGRMVKAIGSAARRELERELDCSVHLDLSVRVRRDWRADDSLLDRLGIT